MKQPKRTSDRRIQGLLLTISVTVILGLVISFWPASEVLQTPEQKPDDVAGIVEKTPSGKSAHETEVRKQFKRATVMLHAKQYDYAIKALHKVLEMSPKMPEAYVNMGYALIGLENYQAAHDFFNSAIELRVGQVNAYYGLAIALEGEDDLEGAIGAMRSYLHLNKNENERYMRRARAALWEWESQLKYPDTKRPAGFVPGSLPSIDSAAQTKATH